MSQKPSVEALPIFDSTAKQLQGFLNRPSSRASALAEIVAPDPALGLHILAAVSKHSRGREQQAQTVSHAISLLGLETTVELGLKASRTTDEQQ